MDLLRFKTSVFTNVVYSSASTLENSLFLDKMNSLLLMQFPPLELKKKKSNICCMCCYYLTVSYWYLWYCGLISHESILLKWPGMVVHACNHSTQGLRAEAGRSLWVWGQSGLHREFKTSLNYIVRCCLKIKHHAK